MNWPSKRRIKHPNWVTGAAISIAASAELLKADRLPKSIEVRMLVVPTKRLLRGVYGSDLSAALALLGEALRAIPRDWYHFKWTPFWHMRVLFKTRSQYLEHLDREIEDLQVDEEKS